MAELVHSFRIPPEQWDDAFISVPYHMLERARHKIEEELPEGAEITDFVVTITATVKLPDGA